MKKNTLLTLIFAFVMMGATACYAPDDGRQSDSISNTATATESDTGSESNSATDSDSDSATDSNTESESGEDKEVYYTVTFNTDGAGDIASVQVLAGETVSEPPTPSKTTQDCEYTFLGWYVGEEKWDFENGVVTSDITLTAHWKEESKYSTPFLPED
ncbi:MAG: InlB B-repeat-containing protein [Clostridia bacterium]|nr:InlB B-repeat-containing protein [Clostridia bacterium]